jgi:hypothetical protein
MALKATDRALHAASPVIDHHSTCQRWALARATTRHSQHGPSLARANAPIIIAPHLHRSFLRGAEGCEEPPCCSLGNAAVQEGNPCSRRPIIAALLPL